MILLQLFLSFLKIGLFTVGGGYAMLALIQEEITRYGWMTSQEFVDVVGIAEMTPGPIAVNAATFVGYRSAGVVGGLIATTAVVLPSLLSVLLVSKFWEKYKSSQGVQSVFAGIRPVVAGLVGAAAIMVGSATLHTVSSGLLNVFTLLLAAIVFWGVYFRKWDPIKVLIASALVGLFIFR